MSDKYYLNDDKTYKPCDLMTWANQLKNMDVHVAEDVLEGKLISTVWLGLDHNYFGGKPLLFETMVFDQDDLGHDHYMARYSSWDEALAGHQDAIQWVKDGCKHD